ncbi:hypothetical protein [Natronosalvus halobius]|uniref:hypothetical protein n=1 Tax=Natronosalvus halobius TaxID=2953746 RepID=UPI00209CAA66|nr:hypothetical protein [Natronosalvus halobius]USZ73236.1 hypothetical protein NGM15_08050 [Natronosalvus halobius]
MSDAGGLSKVALLVGLVLIVIPEPATTATGLAITTASVGVNVAGRQAEAAAGGA